MADAVDDSSGKIWYFGGEATETGALYTRTHSVTPMVSQLLFVGRKRIGMEIGGLLEELQQSRTIDAAVCLAVVTTQKLALRLLRATAPDLVLIETEPRSQSRTRFGEILRSRLPSARLVAVGKQLAMNSFQFDQYWEPPFAVSGLGKVLGEVDADPGAHILQRGPIRLDLLTRTVFSPKGKHHVTPKQCALLQLLLTNHNRVVSRRDIMQAIWETSFMEDTRTLDVHIRWLRERIEPDPSNPVYLLTVRGQGYHLRLPSKATMG
jgi:hypothetical protein